MGCDAGTDGRNVARADELVLRRRALNYVDEWERELAILNLAVAAERKSSLRSRSFSVACETEIAFEGPPSSRRPSFAVESRVRAYDDDGQMNGDANRHNLVSMTHTL